MVRYTHGRISATFSHGPQSGRRTTVVRREIRSRDLHRRRGQGGVLGRVAGHFPAEVHEVLAL
eukprot:14726194-Alexandrium_andersonii.AAC.1